MGIAQDQTTLAKFIIQDARLNHADVTQVYLNAGGYIVFYENGYGYLNMANVMSNRNTQSYGRLYSVNHEKIPETGTEYEVDIFDFRWSYVNNYDGKEGTAQVRLVKIFKPAGVAFQCTIIPENLDLIEYKGFMEGSINFSKY
jgi:hypothetical protein